MNIYGVDNLIREIAQQLVLRCDDYRSAEREAWWLLEKLTGQFEAELLADSMIMLTEEQGGQLQEWIMQRVHYKKPLQYILEFVPFNNLDVLTAPPILIPRPETEEIVAWLIGTIRKQQPHSLHVLDLCTGTGCIALSLAKAIPQAQVVGSDINPQAIVLAEKSKQLNNVDNVQFCLSDVYEQLDGQTFDLIISNPPYLSAQSYEQVSDEIRLWEDPKALVADHDGMAIYERILKGALHHLNKPTASSIIPQLVFEIGIDQTVLADLVTNAGFSHVELFNDMAGKQRWLAAWL